MGFFSRRKSSIQSFGSHPSDRQSQYENVLQLHPLPDEKNFNFNFPPTTPLKDGTSRTNNTAMTCKPSRQLTKQQKGHRPATALSTDTSSCIPKLTPKSPEKNERPPSAASRVFINNGQPISTSGKVLIGARKEGYAGNTISLSNDISATHLRPMSSSRSLKVKSIDLLKSNPRLKYLNPDTPPPPTAKSDKLEFHHDGRGLFASKTVANLADELDTRGLRKLLERDMRRYQSTYDLRNQYNYYYRQQMSGEFPQSRGNTTIRTDGYESYLRGVGEEREYDLFIDPGPSRTSRPALPPTSGGRKRSESMNSRRFEPTHSYRIPDDQQQQQKQSQFEKKHNLSPILLLGKDRKVETTEPILRAEKSTTSPIILLAPNSAKSIETQSTLPHHERHQQTPIQLLSQLTNPDNPALRPPLYSFPTETTAEYETADEFGF